MRKIASSGKTDRATLFSAQAEARSRPNGFSTMTRAFSANFDCPQPFDYGLKERGRNRKVMCGSARSCPAIA